jgi:hypothetical protein
MAGLRPVGNRSGGDRFGEALAAGDFNADGFTDLAIGVPGESASVSGDGGVGVIYGSAGGLSATATPDQFWTQDTPDVEDAAEDFDRFGSAVPAVQASRELRNVRRTTGADGRPGGGPPRPAAGRRPRRGLEVAAREPPAAIVRAVAPW